jgi:hypothetical protein
LNSVSVCRLEVVVVVRNSPAAQDWVVTESADATARLAPT